MRRTLSIKARLLTFSAAVSMSQVCLSAGLTVAFVGDQGTGDNARSVLQLVANEGADLLLIQGDLGYYPNSADQWIANIDDILGKNYPVLLTVGNHENHEWLTYRKWLIQRIRDVPELVCQGNPGVKAHCSFGGISVVQIAPGVSEVPGVAAQDDYAEYLDSELFNASSVWRVCSWHKNQQTMQVGGKPDETGWDVYQTCLKHGGIVATAHEHTYSRTFQMSDFENKTVTHRGELLEVGPGSSFAFVSGLGGRGIREQKITGDWWASIYTANQNANYGALFCTFTANRAGCQFKDIAGAVPDRFQIGNRNKPGDSVVTDNLVTVDEAAYAVSTRLSLVRIGVVIVLLILVILAVRKTLGHASRSI